MFQAPKPEIPNLDDFLAHCHRRRHPSKSTLIYAGDDSDGALFAKLGLTPLQGEEPMRATGRACAEAEPAE